MEEKPIEKILEILKDLTLEQWNQIKNEIELFIERLNIKRYLIRS